MNQNINPAFSSGFTVGDTVCVKEDVLKSWIEGAGGPENAKQTKTLYSGKWRVDHEGASYDRVYCVKEDGSAVNFEGKNLELLKPSPFDPKIYKYNFLVGQTVEMLKDADRTHRMAHEGQLAEIAAIELGGTIRVRLDHHADAFAISANRIKIVESQSEPELREVARAIQKKAHKGAPCEWEYRWDTINRVCKKCGVTQWNLECWTGYSWHYKIPRGVITSRPDLKPEQYMGADKFLSPKPRPGELFRARSAMILSDEAVRTPVNVIGAGAIGSNVVLGLIKMGFRSIRVYDNDRPETQNIGTQLYGATHVSEYSSKVQALQNIIRHLGPNYNDGAAADFVGRNERFGATTTVPAGILIMAVDSMASRKEIWERIKNRANVTWVIDPRMGAENANLFTRNPCDPTDIQSYERTLYTDEAAIQEPCTAQGTFYTAQLISGLICKTVKDLVMGNMNYPRNVSWNIADNALEIHSLPPQLQAERTRTEVG